MSDLAFPTPAEPPRSDAPITLSAEDLLLGTQTHYDLVIPPHILQPDLAPQNAEQDDKPVASTEKIVVIKPLSLKAFQLILNASKSNGDQIPTFMILESLVTPQMTAAQIGALPVGLVNFLVENIQLISGLSEKKTL